MAIYGRSVSAGSSSSGGTTLSGTGTNATSISIDVSAYGDGEYLFGFDGTLSNFAQKLQIQYNGGALAACQGNAIDWAATGAVAAGTTETGGTVANFSAASTGAHISAKGRFSAGNAKQSSLSSQFVYYTDAANHSGVTAIIHTPAAALTSIQLITTQASGIVSGVFWVRKVA